MEGYNPQRLLTRDSRASSELVNRFKLIHGLQPNESRWSAGAGQDAAQESYEHAKSIISSWCSESSSHNHVTVGIDGW